MNVNTDKASRGVWLVKVPRYLSEVWKNKAGEIIGRLVVAGGETTFHSNIIDDNQQQQQQSSSSVNFKLNIYINFIKYRQQMVCKAELMSLQ
jgi:hypothetical protein